MNPYLKISVATSTICTGLMVPLFVGIVGVTRESKLSYTWIYVVFLGLLMVWSVSSMIISLGFLARYIWKQYHPDPAALLPDETAEGYVEDTEVITE